MATIRVAIVLAVAAALTLGMACAASCPSRDIAKGTPTPSQRCVQLAPPVAEAAPERAAPPPPVAEAPPPPEEREAVRVAPGPEVRAAMPLGPVPPGLYRVAPGDSLWAISARAYGDPFRWRDIFEANRARINDPDLIYPFQELRIPQVG